MVRFASISSVPLSASHLRSLLLELHGMTQLLHGFRGSLSLPVEVAQGGQRLPLLGGLFLQGDKRRGE